ncbi:MAG: SDR family NAD(P)-dependent oxidoreductase, partial [Actinomycetota bacterium]|nr:SDR family NAD(P)-dependent oxidoreductase [Actinomycetota bacterium]
MEIAGNVALVTGAASGLGEATARRLNAAGATVIVADIAEERGRAVASDLGGVDRFVRCDVTSEGDVSAAVDAAADRGRLAICVHCGGGGIAARTLARDGTPHDLDAFRRVVELNLVGSFNMLRLAAAAMAKNDADDGGERGVC